MNLAAGILLALALAMAVSVNTLPSLARSLRPPPPPEDGAAPAAGPEAVAEVSPEPAAPAFTPFWVQNYRATEMWSGPAESGGASFGTTSAPFCSFLVGLPQDDARLYVFNPFSGNYFWIDAEGVGPVGVPEPTFRAKPDGQNCAGPVHEQ